MREEWRDVIDYEGFYQVSNLGNVRSLMLWDSKKYRKRKEPKLLLKSKTSTGYWKVELSKCGVKKSYKVHRLVAKAFLLNDHNKPNINHIDNNPLNNNVNNLEWCTQSENMFHASLLGIKHKVPLHEKNEVVIAYKKRIPVSEIAKKYNCSKVTIYKVIRDSKTRIRNVGESHTKYHIDLQLFKKYVDEGKKNSEIQKLFNCSKDIVATRKYQYRKGII